MSVPTPENRRGTTYEPVKQQSGGSPPKILSSDEPFGARISVVQIGLCNKRNALHLQHPNQRRDVQKLEKKCCIQNAIHGEGKEKVSGRRLHITVLIDETATRCIVSHEAMMHQSPVCLRLGTGIKGPVFGICKPFRDWTVLMVHR